MKFLRVYLMGLRMGARDWTFFWTWKSWLGGWMLRLVCSILLWSLMGKMMGSAETLHYLLIGNAVTAGIGTFVVASCCWDRMEGTYSLLVAAPASLVPLFLGRPSIWAFGWVISALLSTALVSFGFDLALPWKGVVVLPLLIVIVSLSTFFFTAFVGTMVAALAPQARNIANNWLLIVFSAICGINVPTDFWPEWVQVVAAVLPITHGLEAIRVVLSGGGLVEALPKIALELAVGAAWLIVILTTLDRMTDRARIKGTIDFA